MIFLYFILALAFVAIATAGYFNYVREGQQFNASLSAVRELKRTVAVGTMEIADQVAIGNTVSIKNHMDYLRDQLGKELIQFQVEGRFSTTAFLNKMSEADVEVELVRRLIEKDRGAVELYSCFTGNETVFFEIQVGTLRYEKGWGFVNSELSLADFEVDGAVECGEGLTMCVAKQECDVECRASNLSMLRKNVQSTMLRYTPAASEEENYFFLVRMEQSNFGGIRNTSSKVVLKADAEKALALSGGIEFKCGNERFDVPAEDSMGIIFQALKSGLNVGLFGDPGTGKTTMSQIVLQRLYDDGAAIVRVDAQFLEMLQSQTAAASVMEMLQNIGEGRSLVFFADEAEQLAQNGAGGKRTVYNTTFLELLDGTMRQSLGKVSVLFTSNAPVSTYDPAFVRDNRIHLMLKVEKMNSVQAVALKEFIVKAHPEFVFDSAKFAALIQKGTATLAEVWSCFAPAAVQNLILAALQKYSKKPPLLN